MKNKLKIIISIVVAVIAIIVAALCIDFTPAEKVDIPSLVSTAQKYLIENNYEQAIAEFDKIIEIDPMNVDAYIGIADAYIGMGDTEKAIEWLEKGYALTGDERLKNIIDELNSENPVEETAVTIAVETEDTTIENTPEIIAETTETIDEEVETIRAQALEILSPFIISSLELSQRRGEPNSILYTYYMSDFGSYECYKNEYDKNGSLINTTQVSVYKYTQYIRESGNIITYLPKYQTKYFSILRNGKYIVNSVTIHGSQLDYIYTTIKYNNCVHKSDDKYVFDDTILYVENGEIYKFEANNHSYYNLSHNSELLEREMKEDTSLCIKIYLGLPIGIDESIFEFNDNEIEKSFNNDIDGFHDYLRNDWS